MRRMFIIATVAIAFVLSIVIAGFQTPSLQARGDQKVSRVRRIQVNAESIAQLASGKKYVVDLTQPGVIYEIDSKTRPIDFTRVMVRTATGEVAISSWLEKAFSKDKAAALNSQHLRIGAIEAFRSVRGLPTKNQTLPTKTIAFQCNSLLCSCRGDRDCLVSAAATKKPASDSKVLCRILCSRPVPASTSLVALHRRLFGLRFVTSASQETSPSPTYGAIKFAQTFSLLQRFKFYRAAFPPEPAT